MSEPIKPSNPPIVESGAQRIVNLGKELVADAAEKLRERTYLNQLVIADRKPPLDARSAAETALVTAIESLRAFYAEHGYQGNTELGRMDILMRLELINATLQPVPPKMTLDAWQVFFALVAAVRSNSTDEIARLATDLVTLLGNTTVSWWLERATAYTKCMLNYGVLEKTRV